MSENAIDSENISKPESAVGPAKREHIVKKAKSAKKADRTARKAEVIAMMKRAKGATLPEIMKATGWQPHGTAVWVFLPLPRWIYSTRWAGYSSPILALALGGNGGEESCRAGVL